MTSTKSLSRSLLFSAKQSISVIPPTRIRTITPGQHHSVQANQTVPAASTYPHTEMRFVTTFLLLAATLNNISSLAAPTPTSIEEIERQWSQGKSEVCHLFGGPGCYIMAWIYSLGPRVNPSHILYMSTGVESRERRLTHDSPYSRRLLSTSHIHTVTPHLRGQSNAI